MRGRPSKRMRKEKEGEGMRWERREDGKRRGEGEQRANKLTEAVPVDS